MVNRFKLRYAAQVIKTGGIVAYPTEAVWGLGCDPENYFAVEQLLRIKQRPMSKGLILVAADIAQFSSLLQWVNKKQKQQLEKSWPGPNTWLVPCDKNVVPDWITGSRSTIALRVSAHPVVRDLCLAVGGPIVSTSANLSNRKPARTVFDIQKSFSKQPIYILPGQVGKAKKPTVIRDLSTGKVVRE